MGMCHETIRNGFLTKDDKTVKNVLIDPQQRRYGRNSVWVIESLIDTLAREYNNNIHR